MAHHHHHHTHDHAHHHKSVGNIRVAFWLNTFFALVELAGGLYTNSVAILSDALHDFGDSLSLGLAYYFEKKSTKKRDEDYSYGYKRFSLLGALVNAIILLLGSVFIIQEAVRRLLSPEQPDARGMLIISILGITVNAIAMIRLQKGSSVNERVVSLHFLEDVLGWAAVLIGSLVMMFADIPVLDPILSILIACYILFNIFKNLREAFHIILQGIPQSINMEQIRQKIEDIPGIIGVHDLHTWTMDGRYNILTAHIVLREDTTMAQADTLKQEVRSQLKTLNIQHVTVETELEHDSCVLKDC